MGLQVVVEISPEHTQGAVLYLMYGDEADAEEGRGQKFFLYGGIFIVCIRRRPPDCRMRANTASSIMALRDGQAAC